MFLREFNMVIYHCSTVRLKMPADNQTSSSHDVVTGSTLDTNQ